MNNNVSLGRQLILDELFDLTLYQELHRIARGDIKDVLAELIPVEVKHLAFWQDFFKLEIHSLNAVRQLKLRAIVLVCRMFGTNAIHLVLEAIEIYGVKKYLSLWEKNKGTALGEAVRAILQDELEHEDVIVSRITERKINPERIRSIFLGFNDGSVEILGAVSGFFAAFRDPVSVIVAGLTVAVAGAISMGAGAFAALSSEQEVRAIEQGKKAFLVHAASEGYEKARPSGSALLVGASYFIGAMVPIMPVLFGADTALISIGVSAGAIIIVSFVLAFLSGMNIGRRIFANLAIIAIAVGVSYAVGVAARSWWGVSV